MQMISKADIPDAAQPYYRALPPGELFVFPIDGLDVTNIPTWKTVFFERVSDAGRATVHNGLSYGPDDERALLGSLGELSESVHAHTALARLERRRASYDDLARSDGHDAVVHPRALCLPAGSSVDASTALEWMPGRRHATQQIVWIPSDIVAVEEQDLAAGYVPFTTPLTNGLGAGPTRDWALAHGVQELLQRDGNGLRFRALDAGVVLDLASTGDPVVVDLLARFARAGIDVLPKFASDEFGITNVYVVGAERAGTRAPLPIMVTAAGEAASPDRNAALRKALLEFGAARARKAFGHGPLENLEPIAPAGYVERVRSEVAPGGGESRALAAMLAWLALDQRALTRAIATPVLERRASKAAGSLPDWSAPDDRVPGRALLGTIAQRLAAAGLDLLYVDLSPQNGELGVHVVKAVVPGLEVETMSYYRIGERNAAKLLASGSELVSRAPAKDNGFRRVRLLPAAEERLGGPVWFDIAAAERIAGPLYPLYREPDVHVAPLTLEARKQRYR